MSFESDIQAFQARLLHDAERLHEQVSVDTHEAITEGSAVTASPGQPVRSGRLKESWTLVRNGWHSLVSTASLYAGKVERGNQDIRPGRGGGKFSVALVRANFDRLVIAALRKIR